MSPRVALVLPGSGARPIGGYKVIYEYANHLVRRGWEVHLVHTAIQARDTSRLRRLRKWSRYWQYRIGQSYRPDAWFTLDPRVAVSWVPSPHVDYVPDGDATVATTWHNAEWIADYPTSKGRKFYLIQNLGSPPPGRELASWSLPLHKIVISRWLEGIARGLQETATYIPNGLDFRAFGIDTPLPQRRPTQVLMLAHRAAVKGTKIGLQALALAKQRDPALQATLYGVHRRPAETPAWIAYHQQPTHPELRALYNAAAVFIAPSLVEGWGLPPSEAMQCGCAVVATDIGGHREFAIDGVSALLCHPDDPEDLAQKLGHLLGNTVLRDHIAQGGNAYVQQFTWERATDRMERTFRDA